MPTQELTDLSHPPFVFPNYDADDFTMREVFDCREATPRSGRERLLGSPRRYVAEPSRRFQILAGLPTGLC